MLNRILIKIILIVVVILAPFIFKTDKVYAITCSGSCQISGWGSSSGCGPECNTYGIHSKPAGYVKGPVGGGCWTETYFDPNPNGPGCSCSCSDGGGGGGGGGGGDPVSCGSNQALVSVNGGGWTSNDQTVRYGDAVSIMPNPLSGRTASLSRASNGWVGAECSDLTNHCPSSPTIDSWWGGPGAQILLRSFQHTDQWWEQLGECVDTLTLTIASCDAGNWSICVPYCGPGSQTNACGTTRACNASACAPSWYQSVGGDVYGNGVSSTVTTTPPPGFKSFLAVGSSSIGSVFSAGTINVGGDTKIAESSRYVKNIGNNGLQSLWPSAGFTPPSTAASVSSCTNMFSGGALNPDMAYTADATCVQTGLTSLGSSNYRLSKDGVVVIYVTGNTSIKFSNNFKAESSTKRIILVSSPKIIIAKDIGQLTPEASISNIDAVLISNTEINFESGANPSATVYDTSIVINGSVISPSIKMLRNRGPNSNYPAELIVYNPYYLTKLILQETNSGYNNYTGLLEPKSFWGNTQ